MSDGGRGFTPPVGPWATAAAGAARWRGRATTAAAGQCHAAGRHRHILHHERPGRETRIPPDKQIILVRKFKENLEPLMCSDTEEVRKKRAGAKYVAESFGAVTTWVPLRTTIIGKHHLSMLKCDAARCRRFFRRFGTKRCTLSAASMRVITAFGLQNSGGSDEGAAAIVAATFMAASMEMGKPLTPTQLGRGSPSQWLLAEWEKRYAAECFVHRCHKMRQQSVKYLHFAGDHGHRQGQDSLVKGWSYATRNKHGERVIEFLCSDVDKCGHTSNNVVAGVKISFESIKRLVPAIVCILSEGDAGGGGSV